MKTGIIITAIYISGVFVNRWLIGKFRRKYPDGMFSLGCIPWPIWFLSFISTWLILAFGLMESGVNSKPKKHSKLYNWFFQQNL